MAAMAYHLKKLLQFRPQQQVDLAVALPKPPSPPPRACFDEELGATDEAIGSVVRKEPSR